MYRSPSKRPDSFLRNLDSTMQKLSGRHGKKHVILVGDLNINLINHATDRSSQDLVDSMASSGFLQLIARPTRLTDHSATLIDHIYTNNLENMKICNIILQHSDDSDDWPIFPLYDCNGLRKSERTTLNE